MPTSITSSGITFDDATTQTTSATKAGGIGTTQLADDSVTDAKLSLAANAGEVKKALNADNSPPIYACRAWVNFDGTKDTTGAASTANTNRQIRASGNVTSVLRNGTGDYTITFTTAMPDANYTLTGTCSPMNSPTNLRVMMPKSTATYLSSSVDVRTGFEQGSSNTVLFDPEHVSVAIFR
jgi:hypothetical protein